MVNRRFDTYHFVRIHQTENNEIESYDGQKLIGCVNKCTDARDPRYTISGASPTAFEYDCGRRAAVIVVRSLLLLGCLS